MVNTERQTAPHRTLSGDRALLPCALGSGTRNEDGQKSKVFCAPSLDRYPRLRMLLFELNSFLHRICAVLRSSDTSGVPIGFLWLQSPAGCEYLNTRSLGRIECIKKLASNRPWATPIDWRAYQEAWDQGVEWALRNFDFDSSSKDERSEVLASELAYAGPGMVNSSLNNKTFVSHPVQQTR